MRVPLSVVLFACLLAGPGSGRAQDDSSAEDDLTEDISDAIDDAMDDIRWMLEGKRAMGVPASHPVRFFKCDAGEVGLLDTLKRTGPVTLENRKNTTVIVRGSFGLATLYLYYPECSFYDDKRVFVREPVNISIADNSFTVQMTLKRIDESGGCLGHLDSVKITKFSGIEVTTNNGLLYWLEDRIIGWTIWLFDNWIIAKMVKTALESVNEALVGKDICSPFKPY